MFGIPVHLETQNFILKEIFYSQILYLLKKKNRETELVVREEGKKDERDDEEAGVDGRGREGERSASLHFSLVCSLHVLNSVLAQFKESNSEYSELLGVYTLHLVTWNTFQCLIWKMLHMKDSCSPSLSPVHLLETLTSIWISGNVTSSDRPKEAEHLVDWIARELQGEKPLFLA